MIQLTCPKCGNVAEFPDDQAGQSVTCPGCGNVSIAPLAAAAEPPPEPVTAGSEIPPPPVSTPTPVSTEKDERMWGMLCHLAALSGFVGVPFGNIVGPLVIWMIQKDKYPSVVKHGKEALNFQISMTIYAAVAAVLILVVIGIFLLIAIAVVNVIFVIIAAIKANNGEPYRYPLTIRFLK